MVSTILVPLDGSSLAECALPYAEALASTTGGHIILLRATLGLPGSTRDYARTVREAESYLAAVSGSINSAGVVEAAVFPADPVAAIVEECRLRDIDLVVMATHGRSGVGRWLYGSVAADVLHRGPAPVLLIHPGQTQQASALARQPRLLVPLDGSDFAEAALPLAQQMADQLAGSIVLARVVPTQQSKPADETEFSVAAEKDSTRQAAASYLQRVAERLPRQRGRAIVDVRHGKVAEALARAAEEHSAAVVVMATHARQGLERLVLGSVADGLLRSGTVPLLLVPPTDRDRSRGVPQP